MCDFSGKLIVFEGIDGVGKTSMCKYLLEYIKVRGYPAVYLKEPSEGEYGQKIREMARSGIRMDPLSEYELFMKDRRENVEKNIIPALMEGKLVILDRYYFSTMAYQGAVGLSVDKIRMENEEFAPVPDLLFLLELSVDESLKRITGKRGDVTDAFETREYLLKVQRIFEQLNDPYIVRVPSMSSEKEVFGIITHYVEEKILFDYQ